MLKIEITTKYSAVQLKKGIVSKILLTNPIKNKYIFDKKLFQTRLINLSLPKIQ